jgi:hypothetical protein
MGGMRVTPALMELMQIDRDYLTPEDISTVWNSNPATIRLTVQEHPERFAQYCPFWTGNRLKFPKMRFIWCMTGGETA